MVLAVLSRWSWSCSLPVRLHGLCCQAIPARERQSEHGWGSTRHSTPALGQAPVCVGWAGLEGTYWGILVWGAAVGAVTVLGAQLGGIAGGPLSEATAGWGLTGAGVPEGPIRTILGRRAVTGLYWCRSAAGGTLTGGHWAGVAHRAALQEHWPDAREAGQARRGPAGGSAVLGPVAVGTHRGGQCRSAAPLRPAGPAGERECARGREGEAPEAVPGERRPAGPVR